jgi:hypothetical protein
MRYINILLICLIPTIGFSQLEEMIIPSDLKQKTVITESSTLPKGFLRTGMAFSFGTGDRIFDESGKKIYPGGKNMWFKDWTYSLSIQYGINDRIQVNTDLPYRNYQMYYSVENILPGYDSIVYEYYKLHGKGISDMNIGVNFQIIKGDDHKPYLRSTFAITMPTGRKNPENYKGVYDYDPAVGDGAIELIGAIQFRKVIYPYSISAYCSYKYHLKGKKIMEPGEDEISFKSGDVVDLSGSFNFHLNDWIAIVNDITFYRFGKDKYFGETSWDSSINTDRWFLSYQPSLVFQIKRFRFYEVSEIPLVGKKYVPCDPSYKIGLQYIF